jgi:hypothetical protein
MSIIATGEKYQMKANTHQELDALLKLVIKSVPDGFFDCQGDKDELGFIDPCVDLSSDSKTPVFLDMFYNGLCTNYLHHYDVENVTSQEDYDSARCYVQTKKIQSSICFEDVLLQVLCDGNLAFEDGYQGVKMELGLSEVASNFLKAFNDNPDYFMSLVLQHANGGSDGDVYDCWIQMGLFGEVIYG